MTKTHATWYITEKEKFHKAVFEICATSFIIFHSILLFTKRSWSHPPLTKFAFMIHRWPWFENSISIILMASVLHYLVISLELMFVLPSGPWAPPHLTVSTHSAWHCARHIVDCMLLEIKSCRVWRFGSPQHYEHEKSTLPICLGLCKEWSFFF